jgi:uncharacterized protein with FMN-binding domain
VASTRSNKKVASSLVAVSTAAVLAVYAAGYTRTRAAAERFTKQAADRRARGPVRGEPSGRVPTARTERERPAPIASAPQPAPADAAPRLASSRVTSALGLRHEEAHDEAPTSVKRPDAPRKVDAAREDRAASRSGSPGEPEGFAPRSSSVDATVSASKHEPAVVPPAAPAPDPVVAAPAPAPAATSKYKDGTYLGWGTSRHGDIQAAVVIEDGRITVARVEQCLTRYSCAWVQPIPPVIIRQQGTTYDYVSGATESSDAFQEAIADALSHAQ